MDLEKQIYDFLKENPMSSVQTIAIGIHSEDIKVLAALMKLHKRGCVAQKVYSLSNAPELSNSNYYVVLGKYKKEEEQ